MCRGLSERGAGEDAPEVFLFHVRDVAEAWRGLGQLTAETQLAWEALYRMRSAQGNLQPVCLDTILHAIGLRLAVARASAEDERSALGCQKTVHDPRTP
jgi:DNA-binding phage protein